MSARRRCPVTDEHGWQCVAAHEDGVREHSFPNVPGKITAQQERALASTIGVLLAARDRAREEGRESRAYFYHREIERLLAAFPSIDHLRDRL